MEVKTIQENKVKWEGNKMHSLEDHNYHIRCYGRCPYCTNGSKPVPKAMIKELLKG